MIAATTSRFRPPISVVSGAPASMRCVIEVASRVIMDVERAAESSGIVGANALDDRYGDQIPQ
jgi:hypothetical protein